MYSCPTYQPETGRLGADVQLGAISVGHEYGLLVRGLGGVDVRKGGAPPP